MGAVPAVLFPSAADQPQQGQEQAEVAWGVVWFCFKMLNAIDECLLSLILLLRGTKANVPS